MTVVQVAVFGATGLVLLSAAAFVFAWGLTMLKLMDLRATLAFLFRRKPPAWRPDAVQVRRIQAGLDRRASRADAAPPA